MSSNHKPHGNKTENMSTNTNTQSHRRPRNRRGGQRNRSGTNRGGNVRPSKSTKPKRGLWQKILAFFGSPEPAAQKSTSPNGKPPKPVEHETPRKSSRKPEFVEVTSPRVYVGNLSFDATESDLQELFGGIGLVQHTEIVFNRHNHRSKGFGFVQFQTIDEAKRAVAELHDKPFMGRKLVVSGAKAADERRENRSDQQPEQ